MIQNVIFDLDGTLLDTSAGILESVAYTAEQLAFPVLTHETLLKFVGPPLGQSFMKYYGCSEAQAQEAIRIYRGRYQAEGLLHAKPYRGIYALCKRLKAAGIRMAVATYKPEIFAQTLLRHFGFDAYCDPIHGADAAGRLQKEDIIRLCTEEMHASPQSCVLIGDTAHDARGAMQAGMPFLAVTWGFGFKTAADASEYPHIGTAEKPADVTKIIADYSE